MDLDHFFGGDGPLAQVLPGYAPRAAQIEMAHAAGRVFRSGGVLLAEAGTGTGKTLAYLVPALMADKKVVVSTATKTLQAQILEKDVPLLARALGRPISATVLKGRQNYLCLRRFEGFRKRPLFRFAAEAGLYDRLERWAGATRTGDRAELRDLPDDYGPWREVCSSRETCWGGKCPREADCHLLNQRRAAQRAHILVVNHHLFFADLAVRTVSAGEVIPRYGVVVFDEAHQIESVATQYFGVRLSSFRLEEFVRDAVPFARSGRNGADSPLAEALKAIDEAGRSLWKSLPAPQTPLRLRTALTGAAGAALGVLRDALGHWIDRFAPRQAEDLDTEAIFRRAGELDSDLARFAADPAPGEVRWVEGRGRGTFLNTAPVEVGPTLSDALFGKGVPAILTSATLGAGGSFAYLRDRLGVPPEAEELTLPSPFDHASQSLLYVPRGLPDPNDASFAARAAVEIASLLEASSGRAFCLFTSHRVLRVVAESLRGKLPYPLLIQGNAPREVLLRDFQQQVHSVLLGAQSFWEGVDVPGDALSAVIIDRIPFASPSDPLVEARIERLRARGEHPFNAYQLPAAAMALRQGVGRLLRRLDDRGVVAVLDRRLAENAYGRYLLGSLPPIPLTRDGADVAAFFRSGCAS